MGKKYFLVISIVLLGLLISFYSYSFKKNGNVIVNDLSFNMTINDKLLDNQIIELKNNSVGDFNIGLTNLNKVNVNYEIIYDICLDSECKSVLTEEIDGINVMLSNGETDRISDLIYSGNDNKKNIVLTIENSSDNDYYIKIGVNVSLENEELILANKISSFNNSNDIIAYVDGIKKNKFPTGCNYTVTYKTYSASGSAVTNNTISFTCNSSTGIWTMSLTASSPKIRVWFTSK